MRDCRKDWPGSPAASRVDGRRVHECHSVKEAGQRTPGWIEDEQPTPQTRTSRSLGQADGAHGTTRARSESPPFNEKSKEG